MKEFCKRLKSPVLWLAVFGLVYSAVLVPTFPVLPDWSAIAGYAAVIFGIGNNPTDRTCY